MPWGKIKWFYLDDDSEGCTLGGKLGWKTNQRVEMRYMFITLTKTRQIKRIAHFTGFLANSL